MTAALRRFLARLPRTMQTGLGIALAGGIVDVLYHSAGDVSGAGHGPVALTGHLVTLAGMALTLLGLAGAARSRRGAEARPATTKGDPL